MTEVDRLEYIISADPSQAVQAFKETGQEYDKMDQKLSTSSSSKFGDTIASGANTAKGAIGNLSGAVDTLGTKLSNISAGQAFSAIESGASKAARTMQGIGIAATAVGVPAGLLAKNSLSAFAELESQTQRNTALLGGSKAEYEEILALSKELGASTPFDALEIGSGIESLAAAGYSLKEIQSAMPTVAEMAIATGEDLGAMSEILIATLNSYGEGADQAATYGDKLATVSNQSSASISDFGESMKYVGAVADSFGVDINELGGAIGVLADNNLKGSIAGTGLREIITTLANPTEKVRDLFESFGLSMDELNPKTQNFVDILAKMKAAGVSDEALMGAFGDRAGPAALILTKNVEELRNQYNTLLNDSEGMLKEFSSKMRDTLAFVMDEMGGTISNILIEIGAGLKPIVQEMGAWLNENQQTLIDFAKNAVEGLTPFVEKFLGLAEKLMDWFNSLPKDMQSKIAGLTGLGAAMATIGGPLLLLGSIPVKAIADVTGALAGLFTVAKGAGGLTGLAGGITGLGSAAGGANPALAALFGPAGILAVGLGAGAFAAYTTNFGNFRDNINDILSDLGSAAGNISTGDFEDAGRDMAQAVAEGFETVGDLIIKGIPEANDLLRGLDIGIREASKEIGKGAGEELRESFDAAVNSGTADVNKFLSSLSTQLTSYNWSDPGKAVAEMLGDGINSFSVSLDGLCQSIEKSLLSHGWEELGAKVVGAIVPGFNSPGAQALLSAGLAGVEGFIKGKTDPESGMSLVAGSLPVSVVNPEAFGDSSSWTYAGKSGSSASDTALTSLADKLIQRGVSPELANDPDSAAVLAKSYGISDVAKEVTDASQQNVTSLQDATTAVTGFGQAVAAATPAKSPAEQAVEATEAWLKSTSTGGPGSPTIDLFSSDPARYFETEMQKDLDQFYNGSLSEMVSFLNESGKGLDYKMQQIYQAGRSEGLGGDMDYNVWKDKVLQGIPEVVKAFYPINTSLAELGVNMESTSSETTGLISAYNKIQDANAEFNKYMSDSSLSTSEAADMQSRLSEINTLLAQSGIDANGGLANLPTALQNVALYAKNALQEIDASLKQAQQYITSAQTASQYKPDTTYKSSMADRYGTSFTIYNTGNTYGKSTDPNSQIAGLVSGLRATGV
jgi:TP901 family phage tail tape measure protein